MSKPLFSVIVPVYNIDNYLERCLESLINQTYDNIEIILVDDGSPGLSPKICDEYANKDVRVRVIHKENGGVTSARKEGMLKAKGEYIACIDGDDWVTLDYFEKFAKVVDEYDPDMVCCGYYEANDSNNIAVGIKYREGIYLKHNIETEIFPTLIESENGQSFPPSLWSKIVRKSIILPLQLAIDSRLVIGEDAACIKACVFHSKSLYIINEPLYYYRYNPTSLTKSRKVFRWDGPKIKGMYLEKFIDIEVADFKEQLCRSVVHSLFNVAVSQFNKMDAYKNISVDIISNICDDYYAEAIKNSTYKCIKGKLSLYALKYKLIILMKIYNKVK